MGKGERFYGLVFLALLVAIVPTPAKSESLSDYRAKQPIWQSFSNRTMLEIEYCVAPSFGDHGVPITVRGEGVTEINMMIFVMSHIINASITVRDQGHQRVVELRSERTKAAKAKFQPFIERCL